MKRIIFTFIIVSTLFAVASADSYNKDKKDGEAAQSVSIAESDYIKQLTIGIDAVNAGEYIKAQKIFNLLIEKYPDRVEAMCGLAITYIAIKKYKSAKELLIKIIEKDEEFSQAYYLLALVQEHLQNYVEALRYHRKYLNLVPDSPRKDKILRSINILEVIKND